MIRLTVPSGQSATYGDFGWESEDDVLLGLVRRLARQSKIFSQEPLHRIAVAREIAAKLGAELEISKDEFEMHEHDPNEIL